MTSKFFIFAFLTSSVLLPPLKIFKFLPTIRPEIFVIILWFFLNLVVTKKLKIFNLDKISKLLIFLIFFSIISINSSYLFLGVDFNYRDFMVIFMILQYLLIIFFGRSIFHPRQIKFFTSVLIGVIFISALIGIFQRINVFNINYIISPIFTENNNYLRALRNELPWARSIGTVGDPRHFGYVLVFGCAAMFPFLMASKRRFFGLLILITLLVSVFFTGSRTSIISVFSVLVVSYFIFLEQTKSFSLKFIVLVFALGGVVYFIFSNLDSIYLERILIMETETSSATNSFSARVRDTFLPFKMAYEKPLILLTGHGPSKSIFRGSMHSDIGWFILRFGIVGIYVYLFIIHSIYKRAKVYLNVSTNNEIKYFFIFIQLVVINWVVFILAESIFKLNQLMSLNMFIAGAVFSPYLFQLANVNLTEKANVNMKSL